jgi:hypothetical protein
MANIPDSQALETWRAGVTAITRGWKVFLLSRDDHEGKIPFHNCSRCDPRTGTCNDREACTCLLCHGFYAATNSSQRFKQMLREKPYGYLAIRTGAASRLLVVDAEAHGEADDPSGLEVLEQWEAWTNGDAGGLPPTLMARSVSGGLHLYYRLPVGVDLPSRTRILPGVDVKSAGGYVGAVGSRAGKREWLDGGASITQIPDQFLAWYIQRRGRGGQPGGPGGPRPAGYDFEKFRDEGCPDGYRDYFFNDLIFRCRIEGKSRGVADGIVYGAWQRCAQPPDARWFMPWEHVKYKLDRIWNEVKDPKLALPLERMQSLARSWAGQGIKDPVNLTTNVLKIGRVTLARRQR